MLSERIFNLIYREIMKKASKKFEAYTIMEKMKSKYSVDLHRMKLKEKCVNQDCRESNSKCFLSKQWIC